ncbi:MAG TPA: DUF1592 domain-containing protein [Polyangia bacterium]|nr:DUF1592 domain-containing protein [Polyangia bacterium]
MARRALVMLAAMAGATAGTATAFSGCSGNIGPTMTTGSAPVGNPTQMPGPPNVQAPADYVPEQGSLRRLTIPQLTNTLADLFGGNMTVTTQFESDTPLSGFASIGAARVQLSAQFVEQLEAASMQVATNALGSAATGRAALVGCTPAGVTDDACTSQFISKFGRRAWRRPLTTDEVTRYTAVANGAQTTLGDFFEGLQYAVMGLLQSPYFIYRLEMAPTSANGKVPFDDYQLATRLSYFLWNTTPDDQLLDAADAHQLTKADGLTAQAQRLLASPRAASAMKTFFTEFYRLGDLDNLPQLPTVFPQVKTGTLGASMRGETLAFLTDLAFGRKGDFRDIFDSRSTFVNAELASLYGLPAGTVTGTGFVPVTQPASSLRAGVLAQASFLSINSQSTRSSPTRRGKFIREMVLCQQVPSPPPQGVPAFPEMAAGTTRDRLTQHRSDAVCATCHAFIDPVGLGLENFDGIGAQRTMENGKPIDASGSLDGVNFMGPMDLAAAVRNHPNSANCVASNMFRYVVGHVETMGEAPAVTQLQKAFSDSGYQFQSLIQGMLANPAFVYAAKPQ